MKRLYINLGSFLRIHILFLPLLAASIFYGYFDSFIAAYVSAFIHEAGHILAAFFLKVRISYIEILPFGICGRLKDDIIKNPDKEIMIALAGPLLSFTIAYLAHSFKSFISQDIYNCIFPLNFSLGILNLIPIIPLDGGRILKASLTKHYGAIPALKISRFISYVLTFFVITISVYGLLIYPFNFSLILISSFLLGNLCTEQKSVSKAVVSEMLRYREKLSESDFNKSCPITALSSTPARKILKKLSYDRYHIIYVLDKNLKIKKVLTEGQVIEAITKKGIKIRLDEI